MYIIVRMYVCIHVYVCDSNNKSVLYNIHSQVHLQNSKSVRKYTGVVPALVDNKICIRYTHAKGVMLYTSKVCINTSFSIVAPCILVLMIIISCHYIQQLILINITL